MARLRALTASAALCLTLTACDDRAGSASPDDTERLGPPQSPVDCEQALADPSPDDLEPLDENDPSCADRVRVALARPQADDSPGEAAKLLHEVITVNRDYDGRQAVVREAAEALVELPAASDEVEVSNPSGGPGRVGELLDLFDEVHERQVDTGVTLLEVALERTEPAGETDVLQVVRVKLADGYIEQADFDPEGGGVQLRAAKELLGKVLASGLRTDLHEHASQNLAHVEDRLGKH